jgi:4-alpha-glucanotransferase
LIQPRGQARAIKPLLDRRSSGVLLHVSSLPGPHGSGDLGAGARGFVRFLARADQRWWQMLPVGPIGPGNSPYSSDSAFAGNPLLISLDDLAREGLLGRDDVEPPPGVSDQRVRYPLVGRFRTARLRLAFAMARKRGALRTASARFRERERHWLDDYALFAALRRARPDSSWTTWSARRHADRARWERTLAQECEYERFAQFIFHRQWRRLRTFCERHGVRLIGDVPVFVAHESADVWAHADLFQLDARGAARVVSGCPPDAFNRAGQLWGHPLYAWRRHEQTGFDWWVRRVAHALRMFDAVRVDHFLGFHRVWAVPAGARTALRGRWTLTPGRALLQALRARLGRLPIIAEDLGAVTPQAFALRDAFGLPGMRVLQFGLAGLPDEHDAYHLPHSYPANCVAYVGTHDNDTAVGWFRSLGMGRRRLRGGRSGPAPSPDARRHVLAYVGGDEADVAWGLIRAVSASPARLSILTAQDLLGLGSGARMNQPGVALGSWEWRLPPRSLTRKLASRLSVLTRITSRSAGSEKKK